jgi:hypothetical protein
MYVCVLGVLVLSVSTVSKPGKWAVMYVCVLVMYVCMYVYVLVMSVCVLEFKINKITKLITLHTHIIVLIKVLFCVKT